MAIPQVSSQQLPTIALIGRTNVGKSSLFNRLTERRHAIVAPEHGTTRDRTYGVCVWRGRQFRLIDTGGADVATVRNSVRLLEHPRPESAHDPLGAAILRQTRAAIAEAGLLLIVVDGSAGVLPQDRQLARVVQRLARARAATGTRPIILLACNKLDSLNRDGRAQAFHGLGLGPPFTVSAKNGRGTGELLDAIAEAFPSSQTPDAPPAPVLRFGMFGRPNVGKSSLVNRLVKSERTVVSPEPLTTRETQVVSLTHAGHALELVDTAGVKPWKKTARGVTTLAQQQSLRVLKQLDIALLILEAQLPVSHQDQALASLIDESKAGAIMVVNKLDLVAADGKLPVKNIAAHYHAHLPALSWAPVVTVSALTGQNVEKILDLTVGIWQRRQRTIPADDLAAFLIYAAKRQRPRGLGKGHAGQPGAERPRLVRLEQTGSNPPEFTLWLKPRQSLHTTYRRFLEHLLTKRFDLEGANTKLYVKQIRPADRRTG